MGNSSVCRTACIILDQTLVLAVDWENSPLQGSVRASGWKPTGSVMLTAGWCVMCTVVFKLCRAEDMALLVKAMTSVQFPELM